MTTVSPYSKLYTTNKGGDLLKNNLKKIRKELHLTQQRLADIANISRYTINQIENDKVIPSTSSILSIAKATNKTVDEIFPDFSVVYTQQLSE